VYLNGVEKISVCIPVYISNFRELSYLCSNLERIWSQKFVETEIVISDASLDPLWAEQVKLMLIKFPNSKYLSVPGFNIGKNVNSAVSASSNHLVKLIFQDDFLLNDYSLLISIWSLRISGKQWHVSACNHFSDRTGEFFRVHRPRLSSSLITGGNSLSSPSVVLFRKRSFTFFSESVTYLVDCDWYLSMSHKNGPPALGKWPLVSNRIHSSQATNWAKHLSLSTIAPK
jgi:hypothetical protein